MTMLSIMIMIMMTATITLIILTTHIFMIKKCDGAEKIEDNDDL